MLMRAAPHIFLTIVLGALALPLVVVALFVSPALAQNDAGAIRVEDSTAITSFEVEVREIRFQLRARSERNDDPIRSVMLLYYVDDSAVQNTAVPTYRPGAAVTASYVWRVTNVLVPGTEIKYQWQVETVGGRKQTTPAQTLMYSDTRFIWREAQADHLTVYFHSVDPQTGTVLLEEGKKTLATLRSEYGLSPDRTLRVFAYARQQDYVSALSTGSRQLDVAMTWGTDRIFVLAPGGTGMPTTLQGLRAEVANAVFRQKTSNPYGEPPRWLGEGFALMMSERQLSAQDYKTLGQMAEGNRLLSMRSLNGNLPSTERELSLAYAQSLSLVRYMYDSYGAQKMRALYAAIKEGNTTDDALRKSLGVTLEQLETRWKNALKNGSAARTATGNDGSRADRPAPSAAQGTSQGEKDASMEDAGGFLSDATYNQPVRFWQGVLGDKAQLFVWGANGFIVLGIIAVVAGTIFTTIRRLRATD
jgi:hypothetical protein